MQLFISAPDEIEWFILFFGLTLLVGLPFICYRAGYRAGKRDGELEALRRNQRS